MAQDRQTYTDIKCEVCGVSWESHTADCPRHAHRPDTPWVARARELRRAWEARRAAGAQNTPEVMP